jgi:hypothetical protein
LRCINCNSIIEFEWGLFGGLAESS